MQHAYRAAAATSLLHCSTFPSTAVLMIHRPSSSLVACSGRLGSASTNGAPPLPTQSTSLHATSQPPAHVSAAISPEELIAVAKVIGISPADPRLHVTHGDSTTPGIPATSKTSAVHHSTPLSTSTSSSSSGTSTSSSSQASNSLEPAQLLEADAINHGSAATSRTGKLSDVSSSGGNSSSSNSSSSSSSGSFGTEAGAGTASPTGSTSGRLDDVAANPLRVEGAAGHKEDPFGAQELVEELREPGQLGQRGEVWVLAQAAAVALVLCPPLALKGLVDLLATLMLTTGVVFIAYALLSLGRNFSPMPQPRARHSLVTSGMYSHVRHPMYSGMVLAAFGLATITRSEARLALAALLWWVLEKKAAFEERALLQLYPGYEAYRQRVTKFLPYIY